MWLINIILWLFNFPQFCHIFIFLNLWYFYFSQEITFFILLFAENQLSQGHRRWKSVRLVKRKKKFRDGDEKRHKYDNLREDLFYLNGSFSDMLFLCFLSFITFGSLLLHKIHLSNNAECVQSGALYLTGGRTEKDRNLAIWDRGRMWSNILGIIILSILGKVPG